MNYNFDDFVGNERVKDAINTALLEKRLPQAMIIEGDEGTGKRTLARLISNMLVCTDENKPCGTCPSCKKVRALSHPDIRIEEGSGKSGNISVETIRGIIEDAYRMPEDAELNIYLLFIKSKMSPISQNKLLKIMEEPPGNALFILVVVSADSLLSTIRSRAVCYTLYPPTIEQAAEYLVLKHGIDENEAINRSKIFRGNIKRMLGEKNEPIEIANNVAEIFSGTDENELLSTCYVLVKDRDLFCDVLENLKMIFRDAIVLASGSKITLGSNLELSEKLSTHYRMTDLIKLPDVCSEYQDLCKKNLNMDLLVTSFCAKIRETVLK